MEEIPTKCKWEILADALIRKTPYMLLIGVYSTDNFSPIALAGSDNVTIETAESGAGSSAKYLINITPNEIKAIICHMKTPDNMITKINMASMNFLCLRHGSGSMTGMSNFNLDYKPSSIKIVDDLLFAVTNKHFTRQDSQEGYHALQMSAILKEEYLAVGICLAGNYSSLKTLKYLIKAKEEDIDVAILEAEIPVRKPNRKDSDDLKEYNNTASSANVLFSQDLDKSNSNGETCSGVTEETQKVTAVNMRRSLKTDADKKREKLKRETEFCEDWRTATIRSIEALKMIGPFGENRARDGDEVPLIAEAEKAERKRRATDVGIARDAEHEHDSKFVRKTSRATLV